MGILRFISSFLAGSLSVFMFLGSLMLLILAFVICDWTLNLNSLWVLMGADSWSIKELSLLLFDTIYLATVAVVGLIGAVCGNKTIMRMCCILAAINSVVSVYLFLSVPESQEVANRFEPNLFKSLTHYDWYSADNNGGKNSSHLNQNVRTEASDHGDDDDHAKEREAMEATKTWDKLQRKFYCCGLKDSKDWFNYSPDKMQIYPKSCCAHPTVKNISTISSSSSKLSSSNGNREIHYCDEVDKSRSSACLVAIKDPINMISLTLFITVISNLVFGILAFLATCFDSFGQPSSDSYTSLRNEFAYQRLSASNKQNQNSNGHNHSAQPSPLPAQANPGNIYPDIRLMEGQGSSNYGALGRVQ